MDAKGIPWGEVMKMLFGKPGAIAAIAGEGGISGCVKFYSVPQGSLVVAELCGLPEGGPGFFALHIHEGGDCGGEDFADTKGHFNPCGKPHPEHPGDLPPLLSCNGRAWMAVKTDRFTPCEVIGRTVVIHSDPDDFHTQPSGNAGRKIACGKVQKF